MSTRTAFTVVGAVIGSYFGNTALGASIGSMVGGYVDPVQVKGPRLTDAQQQTSQPGIPIPLTFGVVRLQGNIIAAGPLVEHKHSDDGKGSGTETTTYSYTRTYAIGICEGPIGGIRRIWRNAKLVYDARSETDPIIRVALNSFTNSHNLYLGTEDQVPDSELQAVFGEDAVPAFRGMAYMVGVNEDVTNIAGAIPTYEFEIVTTGSSTSVNELAPATYPDTMPFGLNPGNSRDPRALHAPYQYRPLHIGSTTYHETLERALAEVSDYYGHDPAVGIPDVIGWATGIGNSNLGWLSGEPLRPWQSAANFNQTSAQVTLVVTRKQYSRSSAYVAFGGGGAYWQCNLFSDPQWASGYTPDSPPNEPQPGTQIQGSGVLQYKLSEEPGEFDDTWFCHINTTNPENLFHYGDYLIECTALLNCNAIIQPDWILVPNSDTLYVDRYGQYHSINDCVVINGSFVQLQQLVYTSNGQGYTKAPVGPVLDVDDTRNNKAFWQDAYQDAVAQGTMQAGLSFPADYPVLVSKACYCETGMVVEQDDVSLAVIVGVLCERAGLISQEIDVSQLTDIVIGFTVATQTNAADAINALAPAFFFDGSEWDKKVWFIKRGGNSVENLSITDSIDSDEPRIKEIRAQDIELPKSLTLTYFDPAVDFATTTQTAARSSVTVNATGVSTVEIPVAMDTAKAAQAAEILIKDKWSALAGTIEQTISDKYSYLTSTDTIHVDSDGALFRVRLGEISIQDGTFAYTGTQDVQGAYTSNVEGYAPLPPNTGVDLPTSPTLAIYMDLPALRDKDDQPGIYVAASGIVGPWNGAVIEVSRDSGSTWQTATTVAQDSIIGQLVTNLPAWNQDIPSDDQTIDVILTSGELSSVTDVQFFQNGNVAVIGNEIIQFKSAVLINPNEYRLSGLIRGRKNTQPIAHAIDENFCMANALYFLPLNRSDMDKSLMFRAVTLGTANSEGVVESFSYALRASTKEFPVTNLGVQRVSGDILMKWSPRARLGNAADPYQSLYWNGYQITFSSGSVTKTYQTSSANFTYTQVMQIADFGSAPSSLGYSISSTNTIQGAGESRGGTV